MQFVKELLLTCLLLTLFSCSSRKNTSSSSALNKLIDEKATQLATECGATVEKLSDSNGLYFLKIVLNDPSMTAEPNVTGYNSATQELVTCVAHSLTDAFSRADIVVDGHTDNVGPYDENKIISLKRAQAVGNLMIREGVNPNNVTMRGLSYDYPIGDNHLIEGRAANRRVEILIIPNNNMLD